MELVVDANILFAALIKDSITQELLFNDNLILFVPEFIFIELKKYELIIRNKAKRSKAEFDELLKRLSEKLFVVKNKDIETIFLDKAKELCPDLNDFLYFAMAFKFDIPLWSNDVKLKKQVEINVFSTYDVLKVLNVF